MLADGSIARVGLRQRLQQQHLPGRRVPDLSGLVGLRPGARYIMLPVEANDELDRSESGGTHPNGDETAPDDGWAAFSGTSAAAPQLAGAAALIKQACPRLTPADVKDILMRTARDVTTGTNALGNTATVGPDTATGNGLVDAHRAVLVARVRCITVPLRPVVPLRPTLPLLPVSQPTLPLLPLRPVLPALPTVPVQPVQPTVPLLPLRPTLPVLPTVPLRPVSPTLPVQPLIPIGPGPEPPFEGVGLSAEDAEAIEAMIIESGEDLL